MAMREFLREVGSVHVLSCGHEQPAKYNLAGAPVGLRFCSACKPRQRERPPRSGPTVSCRSCLRTDYGWRDKCWLCRMPVRP